MRLLPIEEYHKFRNGKRFEFCKDCAGKEKKEKISKKKMREMSLDDWLTWLENPKPKSKPIKKRCGGCGKYKLMKAGESLCVNCLKDVDEIVRKYNQA